MQLETKDRAIVKHTLAMYEALDSKANNEELPNGTVRIFRGKVTSVFRSIGVGSGYYTEIFRQLEGQRCITYLQRGSKSVDGIIVLHHPPKGEDFLPPPDTPLTDPERYANLRESVQALETLVGGIHIAEALLEVEKRLKSLEMLHSRENSVTSHNTVQHKER